MENKDGNIIKNEVKSYIVKEGYTMKEVAEILNKKSSVSLQNFSNKLSRGTIKYAEIKKIAKILGYEIIWKKKKM